MSVLPAVVTQEIELLAGGGLCVPKGEMCHMLLTRQDWFGTMFPLLPVNVQKVIEDKLNDIRRQKRYCLLHIFVVLAIDKKLEFHRRQNTHIPCAHRMLCQ